MDEVRVLEGLLLALVAVVVGLLQVPEDSVARALLLHVAHEAAVFRVVRLRNEKCELPAAKEVGEPRRGREATPTANTQRISSSLDSLRIRAVKLGREHSRNSTCISKRTWCQSIRTAWFECQGLLCSSLV